MTKWTARSKVAVHGIWIPAIHAGMTTKTEPNQTDNNH